MRRSLRAAVTLPKLLLVWAPVVGLNVADVLTVWNCTLLKRL